MRQVPGESAPEQVSDDSVCGLSCAQLETGEAAAGMVATPLETAGETEMKTPPDFEVHHNGYEPDARKEFARIYSKLDDITEVLAEIRSDRRWFKWIAGIAIGLSIGLIGLFGVWSERLNTVERKMEAHSETSNEVHNGLRRDVIRNAQDIERMDHQREWRPAAKGTDKGK